MAAAIPTSVPSTTAAAAAPSVTISTVRGAAPSPSPLPESGSSHATVLSAIGLLAIAVGLALRTAVGRPAGPKVPGARHLRP